MQRCIGSRGPYGGGVFISTVVIGARESTPCEPPSPPFSPLVVPASYNPFPRPPWCGVRIYLPRFAAPLPHSTRVYVYQFYNLQKRDLFIEMLTMLVKLLFRLISIFILPLCHDIKQSVQNIERGVRKPRVNPLASRGLPLARALSLPHRSIFPPGRCAGIHRRDAPGTSTHKYMLIREPHTRALG